MAEILGMEYIMSLPVELVLYSVVGSTMYQEHFTVK